MIKDAGRREYVHAAVCDLVAAAGHREAAIVAARTAPPQEASSMDWNDTPEQAGFRAEVRSFIARNLPARYREDAEGFPSPHDWLTDRKLGDEEAQRASAEWVGALAERRWTAPQWPEEYGGVGLGPMEQFIFKTEMTEAAVPPPAAAQADPGVSMLGPTLMIHGTEEQKKQHIPRILAAEVFWAQGYSEPGAGSDLASLTTRATRDGDEYVINGQKIWTSGAHLADWIFALVRTDPEQPKHRGISFLVMDMKTPGISIRPLVNMADEHHFNETFFDNVRVPVGNRVGEENRGWYVGMTLLDHERSNVTAAIAARRDITRLIAYSLGRGAEKSRLQSLPSVRAAVADRYIESEVMFNLSLRIISIQARGMVPNYEASASKLFSSELQQSVSNTGVKVFGLYSTIWDEEEPRAAVRSWFTHHYLSSVSRTIGGGTSEIQRGIIATRGLGLPRG